MKTLLKILVLACYLAALSFFSAYAEQLGVFGRSFLAILSGYCGIIVVAHLVASVASLCHWLTVVIGRQPDADYLAELAELEIETEAT